MSLKDARPDLGACSGIPDIGAFQFVIPFGMRQGKFRSVPVITGSITSTSVLTGEFNSKIVLEGKFGADQT